jgi:heme exporter protein A
VTVAALLEGHGLECTRGDRLLFSGLDVRVEGGRGLYIAGENGSGKTSLLRILCGLLAPTAGRVAWNGTPIREQRETFGGDLVYVGHVNGVKDDLTAAENLRFGAALAGRVADRARIVQALDTFEMASRANLPTRVLSQGQKRRVALARLLLAADAPLWILDEPFTALDVRGVAVLRGVIEAQLARGGIVVLTTHQDVGLPASIARLDLAMAEPA